MRKIAKNIYYFLKYIMHVPSFYLDHTSIDSTNRMAGSISLKHCHIGKYNYFATRDSFYSVRVGNYCCFGPDVHIGGMTHSYWWYCMSPILSKNCDASKETIIGNDVWISAGCIIKQGVKIGDGAVIGANSFVNKDVPPFSVVAGSPAKIIKYRFDEILQKKIKESNYWNEKPSVAKHILNMLDL